MWAVSRPAYALLRTKNNCWFMARTAQATS